MDSKKSSNKIREIVRLQQILKKWKKLATSTTTTTTTTNTKGINKFLKKTLSFSETNNNNVPNDVVPKGFLAVSVGRSDELKKRFIIPTEYLGHQAFRILLREAEEEFGFQNEGVLKIPCEVVVFQKILKMIEEKRSCEVVFSHLHEFYFECEDHHEMGISCLAQQSHLAQMCR